MAKSKPIGVRFGERAEFVKEKIGATSYQKLVDRLVDYVWNSYNPFPLGEVKVTPIPKDGFDGAKKQLVQMDELMLNKDNSVQPKKEEPLKKTKSDVDSSISSFWEQRRKDKFGY